MGVHNPILWWFCYWQMVLSQWAGRAKLGGRGQ